MEKREQTRERVKRYRERKALQDSVTQIVETVTQSPESVTEGSDNVTLDVTYEHPMMKHLIPGEKREKMEAIVLSLKKFNVLDKVDLGFMPMTIVADYLEATVKP